MIPTLSPLAQRYRLFKEIWADNNQPPLLNQKTSFRGLTPLHVAVILENLNAAERLIKAGAEINCCDNRKWTPLHHAALAENKPMIDLLLRSGANSQLQTALGATFNNIRELLHPPASDPENVLKGTEGQERLITREEFKSNTSANFLSENRVDQAQLFASWNISEVLQDELTFIAEFKQKYLEQSEMPNHVLRRVARDSEGTMLISTPGLGLFASKSIVPKELLGEYLGVIEDHEVQNNFVLKRTNAKEHRNEIPHINDGFINCVLVPIHGVKGLPTRSLFVAAEPIAKGAQFCWNYGFHAVKLGPYVELRGKEVREFIKTHEVQDLMRCLGLTGISGQLSFEDFVKAEKFRYILSTPSTLFLMALEGVLNSSQVKELHHLSYLMECLPANQLPVLRSIPGVALTSKELIGRLKKCFPRVSQAYFDFLSELPARKGIIFTLDFADQASAFLNRKLKQLASEVDLSQEWEDGDKLLIGIMQENYFDVALKTHVEEV